MDNKIKWFADKIIAVYFKIYYRFKVQLYKIIVGREAAAYVLYDSLKPEMVLKMYGAKIGRNVRINRWLILHETDNDFSNLTIGNDVHIGKNVFIDLSGKVKIGNRVGISMFSKIMTHQNLGDSCLNVKYPKVKGDIEIPEDVVISSSVTILFPTKLAEKTLVSAGSVVRGEYGDSCILMGNPARQSLNLKKKGEL